MNDTADAPPYADLTPDAVLNAIDAIGRQAGSDGLLTTGTLLTLNSYENRVFQVGVESADGTSGFAIAKFYRPGRWTETDRFPFETRVLLRAATVARRTESPDTRNARNTSRRMAGSAWLW